MLEEEDEEKGSLENSFSHQILEEECSKNIASASINIEEVDAEV